MTTAHEEWNWAKTHRFVATKVIRPTNVDELVDAIEAHARKGMTVRCVGSRHSFSGIADADVLLDLSSMPERFEMTSDQGSVTVNGAMTYARLAELLEPTKRAVPNTASLPHLTIAGATATGTHGSGDTNGNLATAIRALEIATSTGELRRVRLGDGDFAVAAISLGALGAVVSVELGLEPSFEVEQQVHVGLQLDEVADAFGPLFASAYSVSVFTDWCERFDLWTKRRLDQPAPRHDQLHSGQRALEPIHPVAGQDASGCTTQGSPGLWSNRLPHFRADSVPSIGAEVQSEFFVDRANAPAAIRALHAIGRELAPIMVTSEIRTVRRDDLWLSAQFERDCCAFHFTWHHDVPRAKAAARLVSKALAPFAPLPHWGKVFDPALFDLHSLFPRLSEAHRVMREWDPSETFTNSWMRETIPKQR